jgi:hypothetical protein
MFFAHPSDSRPVGSQVASVHMSDLSVMYLCATWPFRDKYVDPRGKPLTSMLGLQVESSVAHLRLAGQRLPHVAHPTGMHDPA